MCVCVCIYIYVVPPTFSSFSKLLQIFGVVHGSQQVLGKLWRRGKPSALLVGMQTGAATVENSMEFPHKTKDGTAF